MQLLFFFMNKKGSINPNIIWIIIIFVVVPLAVILSINSFNNPPAKKIFISQDVLFSGISLTLREKDTFIIDFAGNNYNFTIDSIDKPIVVMKTTKKDLTVVLSASPLSFDLDDDGNEDVLITLRGFRVKAVEIFFEAPLIKKTCTANWNCSEWSPCLNFIKKRVCVDLNSCEGEDEPQMYEYC